MWPVLWQLEIEVGEWVCWMGMFFFVWLHHHRARFVRAVLAVFNIHAVNGAIVSSQARAKSELLKQKETKMQKKQNTPAKLCHRFMMSIGQTVTLCCKWDAGRTAGSKRSARSLLMNGSQIVPRFTHTHTHIATHSHSAAKVHNIAQAE